MKRIVSIILLLLVLSCSKKDAKFEGIKLEYASTEIQNSFREEGSIAPVIIDWSGPTGTYSINDSSEILQREKPELLTFDTLTGNLTWGKHLPLGAYNFSITAQKDDLSTTVDIRFTNTFKEGFFAGGFKEVDFETEEIDYSSVSLIHLISLNKDGSVGINNNSSQLHIAGTWSVLESHEILVEYANESTENITRYLKGYISNGSSPQFSGTYGNSIDATNKIENPVGIFQFYWD